MALYELEPARGTKLDVTALLVAGVNRLAALVTLPTGSSGYALWTRPALFIDGEMQTEPGTAVDDLDRGWQTRLAGWISSEGLLMSLPTDFQEHLDRRREPRDWRTSPAGKGWAEAFCLGPAGTPPWTETIPRPLPMLEEKPFSPTLVWRGKSDRRITGAAANLAVRFNREPVDGAAVSPPALDHWCTNDTDNVFVFDFGKTRRVRPGAELAAVSGNTRIEFYYDIKMAGRPTALAGFARADEGFCDTLKPAGRTNAWETLTARGFRFMTVKVTGTGTVRFRPACKVVEYPFPAGARFCCDDPFWNRAWPTSAENLRSSTSDVIVDSCARENSLWTIDAAIAAKAAFYTFGETKMWRHCLSLIAQGIDEAGNPCSVVPAHQSFLCIFDQAMLWLVSCREYYMATDDVSLLEEITPAIERFLALCERHITTEDLFVPPTWSWHWVDWAPIDKRAYSLPVNTLLLLAANTATKIAATVEHPGLQELAYRIGNRLRPQIAAFYDRQAGAFSARLEPGVAVSREHPRSSMKMENPARPADHPAAHGIHGNILACLTGCGSDKQRRSAAAFVARCLRQDPNGVEAQFGPAWTDRLLQPLFPRGHAGAALSCIESLYGAFIDHGAPTWAELFGRGEFNSAHGWGASVNSLIAESIVGLKPAAPGWRRILLQPAGEFEPGFSYSLDTPAGTVSVESEGGSITACWPKGVVLEHGGTEYNGTDTPVGLPRQ